MQILLNAQNLQAAVLLFIQDRITVGDDESVQVELTDEGATVTIIGPDEVHTEVGNTASEAGGSKPTRKPRQSRSKPKEEPVIPPVIDGEPGKDSTPTGSAENAAASDTASSSGAGGESQPESPANEPETPVTPTGDQPEQPAEPAVVVDPAPETPVTPEPLLEEPEQPEQPKATPTASLFANLRKPKND